MQLYCINYSRVLNLPSRIFINSRRKYQLLRANFNFLNIKLHIIYTPFYFLGFFSTYSFLPVSAVLCERSDLCSPLKIVTTVICKLSSRPPMNG